MSSQLMSSYVTIEAILEGAEPLVYWKDKRINEA